MQRIEVNQGDASQWLGGPVHLVLTHPYASLPPSVCGIPAVLNLYERDEWRQPIAEKWASAILQRLGVWGAGRTNTVYVAHLPVRKVVIDDLVEDGFIEGVGGPFPIELPLRILHAYSDLIRPGMTVWDGFCGRGTVGKACARLGLNYVGLDIDAGRVALARQYIGL
jgi:hypothetical protein